MDRRPGDGTDALLAGSARTGENASDWMHSRVL
jgi:hypothetical protein